MRVPFALAMLLLAPFGCKRSTPPEDAGGLAVALPASASANASTAAPPTPPTRRAEPVAGQYGRFYCDERRFSAAFAETPVVKVLGAPGFTAVEAQTESNGIGYAAICGPVSGQAFERAHDKAVGDGKLLGESHPKFFGSDAVEVRVALRDGGERMMLLVRYAGRFCSVGVEMDNAGDETLGQKFLDSFRPEVAPTP